MKDTLKSMNMNTLCANLKTKFFRIKEKLTSIKAIGPLADPDIVFL